MILMPEQFHLLSKKAVQSSHAKSEIVLDGVTEQPIKHLQKSNVGIIKVKEAKA